MRIRPDRSGRTSAWPSTGCGRWMRWAAWRRCNRPASRSRATACGPAAASCWRRRPRGRRPQDPLHSVTLMRADLVTALRAAAAGCGRRDHHWPAARRRIRRAEAECRRIVGADGIWSATRRALDPAAPQPARRNLLGLRHVRQRAGRPARRRLQLDLRQARGVHLPSRARRNRVVDRPGLRLPAAARPGRHRRRRAQPPVPDRDAGTAVLEAATSVRAANLGTSSSRSPAATPAVVLIGDAATRSAPARAPPSPWRTR